MLFCEEKLEFLVHVIVKLLISGQRICRSKVKREVCITTVAIRSFVFAIFSSHHLAHRFHFIFFLGFDMGLLADRGVRKKIFFWRSLLVCISIVSIPIVFMLASL